jgi:hypothetical protein
MASTATPYGLRAINLIGGQVFAGSFREIKLSTNNTNAIFNGDIVQLTSAGNPQALTATPTAGTTAGIVGVCVGVRYVTPGLQQPQYAQFCPAGAITAGYTDVYIRVCDDPDALFQVQGSAAFGSLTNGASGAVGKNAALGNFSAGSTSTGNSGVNLVVGANGGSLASTATLAMRVVDYVEDTATDTYPDLIVKFNFGTHSYYFATGV